MRHNEKGEKDQLRGTDTRMTKIPKLADQNLKCQLNIPMFKHVKETMNTVSKEYKKDF